MGLVLFNVEFDFPAPKAEVIVDKISEISGLPVLIIKSFEDELRDSSLLLAFKSFPKSALELYTYRPGSVKAFGVEFVGDGYEPNWHLPVEGSEEKEGKQKVYLTGYLGQELTLFYATTEALIALGGVGARQNEDVTGNFKFPITHEELEERHRKQKIDLLFFYGKLIAMLPILIPVYSFKIVASTLKLPFQIRRVYRTLKDKSPNEWS